MHNMIIKDERDINAPIRNARPAPPINVEMTIKKSEGTSVVFFLMITIGSKANTSSHQMVSSLALRLVKDFNVEIAPDFAQWAWMLKYPSAITSFGHIAAQAKDKKIAVFLDYDGTLVDV
ncbi:hypothetical protein Bca101_008642 [Brassica carinata]